MLDVKQYKFNRNECWFKKACEDFGADKCRMSCPIYLQFYYLVNLAEIPKRLQYPENLVLRAGADKPQYMRLQEIKNNIYEWVSEGNNLFIYSENCGNGKTTWAIKLMLKYFSEIMMGNGLQCRGFFIDVNSFLFRCKNDIGEHDARFNEIKQLITTVPLVIWDDIGVNGLTEYEHRILFMIINTRVNAGKSNIFTSNLGMEQLKGLIGQRLFSRIVNTSECIELTNKDHRGVKGDDK